MKEYTDDDAMLCFVQGFECRNERENNNNEGQTQIKRVSLTVERRTDWETTVEVKRSLSERGAPTGPGPRTPRRADSVRRSGAIRKTRSTGNFVGAGGGAAGGGGAPRSAPATPLQPPDPRHVPVAPAAPAAPVSPPARTDKNAVKQLSSSAPSVRGAGAGAGEGSGDSAESKPPSKARQNKFLRHFPQVSVDERVLNYYSCALVGDILLQGHLYITTNYFAFYSNVFGYVTKLLIPTSSVVRVSKEKMARIIPNAVGVCTRDERHVFGSLLSRDSTYKLMLHVWKAQCPPPPPEELRISEVELDASEYSPEDESSSGGGDESPPRRDIITAVKSPAVIQPSLLLCGEGGGGGGGAAEGGAGARALLLLAVCLLASALVLARAVWLQRAQTMAGGEEVFGALLALQETLHGQAAGHVHLYLNNNLHVLAKVRQSLEALSAVLAADSRRTDPPPPS